MMLNCYTTKNTLSGLFEGIYTFRTDKEASVNLCLHVTKIKKLPLEEHELTCIGSYDNETNAIYPTEPRIVEWDTRRLFEPQATPKAEAEVLNSINNIQ